MSTASILGRPLTEARAGSRREEILTTAADLFAARSYHGTRLGDLAAAAGLNKATLYHYFESKSLILWEICRTVADSTVEALDDCRASTARGSIHNFTQQLLVSLAHISDRVAVYVQEGPYINEWLTKEQVSYIRRAENAVYEHVRTAVEDGVASGEFYDCDPHVMALGYVGMTLGSYRWLRLLNHRTTTDIAAELSSALLRGLVRDGSLRAALGDGPPSLPALSIERSSSAISTGRGGER